MKVAFVKDSRTKAELAALSSRRRASLVKQAAGKCDVGGGGARQCAAPLATKRHCRKHADEHNERNLRATKKPRPPHGPAAPRHLPTAEWAERVGPYRGDYGSSAG